MRLDPERLAQHLQRGLQPLYVVAGDEPLLALEAADAIRVAAVRAGFSERTVLTVERDFNWAALAGSGSNLSLFGTRRVLEIRMPSGKPGSDGAQALQGYARALPPDTLTLVSLPRLDKEAQAAKWFKALEQAGAVVAVYPVKRAELPQWIARRLARQDQRADADTLHFLADRVEGNLLAAHQEVQKLGLLFPPGLLSFADVEQAVLDVTRYDAFQLADAMLAGDAARAVRILEGLQGEGVEPVLVLWAMSREIRLLAKLRTGVRRGAALEGLLREQRVWESRQPLVKGALRRLSEARLLRGLKAAAEADKLIKGLAKGDVWDTLQQLALLVAVPKAA